MLSQVLLFAAAVEDPSGFLAVAPLLDLGASGVLIGLIIWLIRKRESLVSSGEWVPRRELDYIRADRDARLAEKEREIERERQISAEYRAAHETSERAREILLGNSRDLVHTLGSLERFFDSFRSILERIDRDREARERDEDSGGA